MHNSNKSAGSSNMSLGQVFALFGGNGPSEAIVKGFLYIIGIVLTPVTLFGALLGFKWAYNRIGLPEGEKPDLKNLKPIVWIAMLLGAALTWLAVIFALMIVAKLAGNVFDRHTPKWIAIAVVVINLVASAWIFRLFGKWQHTVNNNLLEAGRFGSARWANEKDLADLERKNGIYIGNGIYGYNKQGHILTQGGARGGKGITCVLPNLLGLSGYTGSWFIIDVKGELTAVSARFQRSIGQNVVILDPWGLNTKDGASYNPLDLVADQTNPDSLIDDISIIAEMIVPKETQGDQFWNNKARSLVAGMILHMLTTTSKEKQTLGTIWKWLHLPQEELDNLLTDMAVSDSEVVRATANEYISILQTATKMFQSIMATAQEKTDFLKSPALQKSLEKSSFDINGITDGKTTLYVIIPPDKLDSHYQWLRLVMTTALRSAVRNHDKRITFLLDEFAALGYLPEIKTALSTYAGYNITMWPIVQDLGQLKTLYGSAWETFISNTAVRQFLSVSDVFSLEYLSKLMGTTTTVSYDDKDKAQATARPLVTPDEIRRASADNVFTLIEQRPPVCFSKIPYYEMPTLKGMYDDNPYYRS